MNHGHEKGGLVITPRIMRWANENGHAEELAAAREMVAEFRRLFPKVDNEARAVTEAKMKRAEDRVAAYRVRLALMD